MLFTYSTVLAILASAAVAAPIPLNINLGAYSPALVVGDGEISFGSGPAQGPAGGLGAPSSLPATIIGTLQGATSSAGAAVAEGQAIAPTAGAAIISEPASLPAPGVARELGARDAEAHGGVELEARQAGERAGAARRFLAKRQSGFDRALAFAEAALTKGPKIQLGTPAAGVGIIVDNNPLPAALPTLAE